MQPITARTGLVAEAQAMPSFAQPRRQLPQSLGTVLENPELPDLAAATGLGKRDRDRRLVHIHPDVGDSIHQARLPCMRLCAGHSGTTLDILHVERRAADHSANIGSNIITAPYSNCRFIGLSDLQKVGERIIAD